MNYQRHITIKIARRKHYDNVLYFICMLNVIALKPKCLFNVFSIIRLHCNSAESAGVQKCLYSLKTSQTVNRVHDKTSLQ